MRPLRDQLGEGRLLYCTKGREQVFIETKVTRTKSRLLGQQEIANQFIIEKQRYRTHPVCKTLVCFVYDPSHVCDNVAALESDVSSDGMALRSA